MPNDKHGRPSMATYSGVEFLPLTPLPAHITIEDIAHGLSFTCRYGSQVPKFYSVAEHSVLVCELLEMRYPQRLDLHRWGLMHDASEAYLGDLIRPLKDLDPRYKAMEAVVMEAVAVTFGLGKEQPEEIHTADVDVFLQEREILWEDNKYRWWKPGAPPADAQTLKIIPLGPEAAKPPFLAKFRQLFGDDSEQ